VGDIVIVMSAYDNITFTPNDYLIQSTNGSNRVISNTLISDYRYTDRVTGWCLGMDFLSKHHVILDAEKKRIGIVYNTKIKNEANVKLIVGLSCGGFVVAVLIGVTVPVCLKRRKK